MATFEAWSKSGSLLWSQTGVNSGDIAMIGPRNSANLLAMVSGVNMMLYRIENKSIILLNTATILAVGSTARGITSDHHHLLVSYTTAAPATTNIRKIDFNGNNIFTTNLAGIAASPRNLCFDGKYIYIIDQAPSPDQVKQVHISDKTVRLVKSVAFSSTLIFPTGIDFDGKDFWVANLFSTANNVALMDRSLNIKSGFFTNSGQVGLTTDGKTIYISRSV